MKKTGKISEIHIGVRGFPNGIFNPWARWITGLALAKNFSAAVAVAVVALRAKSTKNNNAKLRYPVCAYSSVSSRRYV